MGILNRGKTVSSSRARSLGSASFRPDEGYGPCPEFLVGHGHDHGLVDPFRAAEGLLYLLGLDVLAARDKEVVPAAQDAQVAIFVELAEVSGMEPAFRRPEDGLLFALDVAREERLAPDQDLPSLGDGDLAPGQHPPRGTQLSERGAGGVVVTCEAISVRP